MNNKVKHILLVDDNKANIFLNTKVLKKNTPDLNIDIAYNGLEALQLLETKKINPQVILLDINMPIMNGYEFLENYNKLKINKSLIVVNTGQNIDSENKNLLEKNYNISLFTDKILNEKNLEKITNHMLKN